MKVRISKGDVVVNLDRSDLVTVDPTHDGIVFNFKNGTHFYNADQQMPTHTKHMIKAGADAFEGDLTFNLLDYRQPVSVSVVSNPPKEKPV